MNKKSKNNFFDDINFRNVIDNIKGILTSDGSISLLLDFERVLDEADLYAFKNWELGELIDGPLAKRYNVTCVFMWPYNLMPDPRGAKRLANVGCTVEIAKSKIKLPIKVQTADDFINGTKYPKSVEKKVWVIKIDMPRDLLDDIREGSIDLADQTIDLDDLDEAYEQDLDKEDLQDEQGATPQMGGGLDIPPMSSPESPTGELPTL